MGQGRAWQGRAEAGLSACVQGGQPPFLPHHTTSAVTRVLPCRHYMDRLLPLVISKRYDIAAVVSHRMPLSAAAAAYQLFDGRSGGCTKVVMRPW